MASLRRRAAGSEVDDHADSKSDIHWQSRKHRASGNQSRCPSLLSLVKHFLVAIVVLYLGLAATMYLSQSFRDEMIFLSSIRTPFFANFSNSEAYGLEASNFYLSGKSGKLGAWYVPSLSSNGNRGNPIYLLYLHGNGGTRAVPHRVDAMKVFTDLGFNCLIVDYRGYADSEGVPSEKGLVEDALVAYDWLMVTAKGDDVLIWGHSLGSGVATQLGVDLSQQGSPPFAIVMEGAFSSIRDGAYASIFSQPYLFWPHFDEIFLKNVINYYKSDEIISKVKSPILMLHEKHDPIIHFELGQKLYNAAAQRKSSLTLFVPIDEGLAHNFIHRYSKLDSVLWSFINGIRQKRQTT